MIKIKIIAPAKLKESYLREASAEYEKRLSRYCNLETVEPEPVRLPEKPSQNEIAAALDTEGAAILKKIPEGAFVIALCIEGKMLSSEELCAAVSRVSDYGCGSITFILGSSYGLSPAVKQRADLRLSLSAMTFPHQLARIMLLEQIYRSFKISEGGTYHK